MTIPVRYIVAVVLLLFAWKGSELSTPWPPAPATNVDTPKPSPELLKLAEPLQPILPRMLPKDRLYLSSLYDALAYVLIRDGEREKPIVSSNDAFANFHAGTLRLSIDKAKIGAYQGLDKAIDEVFVNALGADARELSRADRENLIAACGLLSWSFGVGRDE